MKQRITCVISSLGPGGAERVMAAMCNDWADQGRDVTLINLIPKEEDHYDLRQVVDRRDVKFFWTSANALMRVLDVYRRLRNLREAIVASKPDVVISFTDKTNIRVLLSLLGTDVPVIVSERCDPAMQPLAGTWTLLRRITYPKADAVVAQTDNVGEWLRKKTLSRHVVTIPNFVRSPEIEEPQARDKIVVAMGRLVHQKGFDLLLKSWAGVHNRDDWTLLILGEGEDRDSLQMTCQRLKIEDSVQMPGTISDPDSALIRARIFVLSSRFEGFPNALLEGMAAGLPAASFDCPSGPSEIIRSGVDGYLVPAEDCEALTGMLEKLMAEDTLRAQLAVRAQEVVDRFSRESVMASWDKLISDVIARKYQSRN